MIPLPIDEVLADVVAALAATTSVVLQAPPGAGKTTRVPLALLGEPWLAGRRIVMLEPRRLAARAAAVRMAGSLGERLGETVGYRVRGDTVVGSGTRIEVVTEGILTRLLQSDPTLDGVGLVIFDEFHERSIHADVGLALVLQSQQLVRNDLRVLVMSATLDGAAVAEVLGGAPIVTSEGRGFPVEIEYRPRRPEMRVEGAAVSAVRYALAHDDGDVLVFLPGAGEIARVESALMDSSLAPNVRIVPLFGDLAQGAQDAAIAPSPAGARKVVLATSIAETSLTIEGVRVVIDTGLARVPRFSPQSGMTRLDTIRASRDSADQRCGRAGRVAPGRCYRLWDAHEQHQLAAHRRPEILDADLAPLVLELAVAGVTDPAELRWLDLPPAGAFAQARELLMMLGALDALGRVTAHGGRMAELAMHPRLAHMTLVGASRGEGRVACYLAALLGERDIAVRGDGNGDVDSDLRTRLEIVLSFDDANREGRRERPAYAVDAGRRARVIAEARRWARHLRVERERADAGVCGRLLALAYPDRVAQRRAGAPGRFLLRNGRGAVLPGAQSLSTAEYLVVADLDGRLPESRIYLAAEVSAEEIHAEFSAQIETETLVEWDDGARAVRARQRDRLGAIVLREQIQRNADPAAILTVLLETVRKLGVEALPWSEAARRTQARMQFLHLRDAAWPDVSDATLLATLDDWLAPHVDSVYRLDDLQKIDLTGVLLTMIAWEQRAALDLRAPEHYVAPTGSQITIDYSDASAPVVAVRLQEMFGETRTPSVDRGAVPLLVHLLSPARRPVQVTRDLAGFWRSSYFDVRKEMRGRYPKHHWPDDPLEAAPTRSVRRRSS